MNSRVSFVSHFTLVTCLAGISVSVKAEPWTPAQLTTELWLDAADADSITKDDDDLVSQWNDKSGNDRHVSEGNDDDKPIYEATGFKGGTMPALFFPDPGGAHNGRALVHALAAEIPANDWALFAVINDQSDQEDATENMLLAAPAGGFNEHRVWLGAQGTSIRSDSGNGGSSKAPEFIGEQQLYFALAETTSEVLRNGTQVAGNNGTYVQRPIVTRIAVGARGDTGHAGINGKIAEYILMAGIPSATDRQLIEGYLAHKWGLAGDLPNDHPYKNAAPGTGGLGFAITTLDYNPDAEPSPTVTLTWRKTGASSYIARFSRNLSTWVEDLDDSITLDKDENTDDAEQMTVTFPLKDGLENDPDLFFRIEEG